MNWRYKNPKARRYFEILYVKFQLYHGFVSLEELLYYDCRSRQFPQVITEQTFGFALRANGVLIEINL